MITVVVDANILLSGLINPFGSIPEILIKESYKVEFVIPNYAFAEIQLHKDRICKIVDINISVLQERMIRLTKNAIIFADDAISGDMLEEAERYSSGVDSKDVMYIAYSLELNALLWTGDKKLYKGLRRKKFKNVISTTELRQIIKGL